MKKNLIKTLLSIFLITAFSHIWADDVKVEDINYPGIIKNSNGDLLVLNGAGLRTKYIFDVYTIGLYVPKKSLLADEVLKMKGPKLVEIHMLRDVKAKTFIEALQEGLEDNDRDGKTLVKIKPQVEKLVALMMTAELKKGDDIIFEFNPTLDKKTLGGMSIFVNKVKKGIIIGGEDDFYTAIVGIWIGKHPVDKSLKSKITPE